MMNRAIFLAITAIGFLYGESEADLAARFRNPPANRRTLQITHSFPSDENAVNARIEEFSRRGFGGLVVSVGGRADYLTSEQRWKEFRTGVQAARSRGMTLWIYDERGYPSVTAGGLTLQGHPEWEALGLHCIIRDPNAKDAVSEDLPDGEVVSAMAFPAKTDGLRFEEGIDITDSVRRSRKLRTEDPAKPLLFAFVRTVLYERAHATANLSDTLHYPNILMREPVKRFLELTHEAYARRFTPIGSYFEAVFTDEPSLMSLYLRPGSPYPPLPWSDEIPRKFREAFGYDIATRLPALAADFGVESTRVRCDFWDLIGRLVSENYFGQIQKWCRNHGIASTGHLLYEEDLGYHVALYGNFYECASKLDIPGIDCLTSDPAGVPWFIAKLLGSISCVTGAAKTMSETSDHVQAQKKIQVTAEQIQGTMNKLYVSGINTTTSYYRWAGLDDQTVRSLNERIGRMGTLLEGGRHRCDVAVLYPLESVWARFTPQRFQAKPPKVVRINRVYRETMQTLFENQRDFDIVDSRTLVGASSAGRALKVRDETYRVLLLPAVSVLPADAIRKIDDFARRGGRVIAIGDRPYDVAGSLTAKVELLPEDQVKSLPALLDKAVDPDLRAGPQSPIRYRHFERAGRQMYFLINDSPRHVTEMVRMRASRKPKTWDISTGVVSKTRCSRKGCQISLGPYGATFLSFQSSQ